MKLSINKSAEVSHHIQMPGMEITMERRGPDQWQTQVWSEEADEVKDFTLNDRQAAATMALLISDEQGELTAPLYAIAEEVWKDAGDFRPIP